VRLIRLCCAVVLFSAQLPPDPEATLADDTAPELELFSLEELDAKVTTATGGAAEERSLTSANVVVITRDEIRRRGHRSLAEVLATVPGLYVVDDLVIPSLGVRGVTGGLRGGTRVVRVMINGVEVNFRPDLTAFLGPEYLPIDAVERVEVAKGPLSALYGANAFLATVNVITRQPERGAHGEATLRGALLNGRPGFGASALLGYGGEQGGLFLSFSLDRLDRSGLSIGPTFQAQDPALERYRDYFSGPSADDWSQPWTFFGQARVKLPAGTFTAQGGFQGLDSGGEFQLNSALSHASRVALMNSWLSARYELDLSPEVHASAQLGWSRGLPTRDMVLYRTGTQAFSFRPRYGYTAGDAALEVVWAPSPLVSVRVGVDGLLSKESVLWYSQTFHAMQGVRQPGETVELIGADVPRTHLLSAGGISAQVASTPFVGLPDLRVTASYRMDGSTFGPYRPPSVSTWRLAAAYRWNDSLTTKLIGGRSFQAPSGVMMFAQPGFGTSNTLVGNLTLGYLGVRPLKVQTARMVEAVAIARLFEVLAVEGAVFFQYVQDRIEFIQSGTDFVPENRGDSPSTGAELTARASLGRFSPYLAAEMLLAWQDGALTLNLPHYPAAQALAGLDADIPELRLRTSARLRVVGPRGASQSNVLHNNGKPYELPGYASLDLSATSSGWRPFGGDAEVQLQLTVTNALDARYHEPGFGGLDLPNVGRGVFLDVRTLLR
jgi:iron complex outermembrane receptor protein